MKKSIVGCLTSTLFMSSLSLTSFAAGPNPSEVYVNHITYGGTGCPDGSVAQDISGDAKAFTVIFDKYLVEVGPGVPRENNRKFCQLTVDLHIPEGWSYTLFDVTYSGFASLDSGTSGIGNSTYYFEGAPSVSYPLEWSGAGPFSGNYRSKDTLAFNERVWAACGVNRALNIKSSLEVSARDPNASATVTIDTVDGELAHRYGIAWRRCVNPAPNDVPWSVRLLDSSVPDQLKVSVTTETSKINKLGALYVAALYQGKWFFWDPNQAADQRWVTIADPTAAATLPEAIVGQAPAVFEYTATEILTSAHGAQVFFGVGYGAGPSERKTDFIDFQRYSKVYVVP
jgi:hypothetical protein